MPADVEPTQFVSGLMNAVRNLASDHSFQLVADVLGEVQTLKEQNNRLSSSHRETLEEYRKFRNELEGNEAELRAAKGALQATVQQKQAEIDVLTLSKLTLEEDVARFRSDQEKSKEDLKELQDRLESCENALQSKQEALDKLESDLTETKDRLSEVDASRVQLEGELAEHKTKLTEAENATSKVNQELDEVKENLAKTEEARLQLQQTLEDTTAKLAETDDARLALQQELGTLKDNLAELESEHTKLTDDFSHVKSELEEKEAIAREVQPLREALAGRDIVIGELKDQVKSVEERLQHALASTEDMQKSVDQIREELKLKSESLADLEQRRVALKRDPEDT